MLKCLESEAIGSASSEQAGPVNYTHKTREKLKPNSYFIKVDKEPLQKHVILTQNSNNGPNIIILDIFDELLHCDICFTLAVDIEDLEIIFRKH